MKDVSLTIAENIRDLRKSKALTQSDLASELGYTVQAISRWEKAKSLPDPIMLYKLAEFFKVDITYFYMENHLEIDEEKEKIIKKRDNIFRIVIILSFLFSFGLLAATVIFLIDESIVHITLWILSFIAISIMLLGVVLKNQTIIKIFIPVIIITLVTSLYFSLKEYIANLKYIFIPMVVILLAYFVYLFFLRLKK